MIWSRFFRLALIAGSLTFAFALPVTRAEDKPAAKARFKIKVTPVGISAAQVAAVEKALLQNKAIAPLLEGSNHRLLYTELPVGGHDRFRTVFYNYTRQETIVAEGSLAQPAAAIAHVLKNWQPQPNEEEYEAAVAVLRDDPVLGPAFAAKRVDAYRPMPPVQGWAEDAVTERIVNVGLFPRSEESEIQHEIVGVNMARKSIVHYAGGTPHRANAASQLCGLRPGHQATTSRGTEGQYQLTIMDSDGSILWDMLVLRPSISSGTNASGIELQQVKYKNHSVFKRAHLPILNVLYDEGPCGPYRDWTYQEGMFDADGTDIAGAPGFRDCGTNPAQTILDDNEDKGNFRGVAIYQQDSEVVLVTELEAGWYRYIHEWGFDADGTIHPRFGFGAVANSCTCFPHTHHAYFRFDFDVDGDKNSIYQIAQPGNDARIPRIQITTETKVLRDPNSPMYYQIRGGKRSYLLYPGENDGIADNYGRGDFWFLHWHDGPDPLTAEIDDGHGFFERTEADLDQFVNGESLDKEDVVVWYQASFLHLPGNAADGKPTPRDGGSGNSIMGPEVVGPDLVPVGY
jgi:hypothetical protein